jgi:hypothetical protein
MAHEECLRWKTSLKRPWVECSREERKREKDRAIRMRDKSFIKRRVLAAHCSTVQNEIECWAICKPRTGVHSQPPPLMWCILSDQRI